MNVTAELLKSAGIVAILCAIPLIVVHLKYGSGLATKMFDHVVPIVGLTAFTAASIGRMGRSSITFGVLLPVAFVLNVVLLMRLWRVVVAKLEAQVQVLNASQSTLAVATQQTAATATQQAATVAQVSTTVEEIAQTSGVTAETAQQVLHTAADAVEEGQRGLQATGEAVKVMEDIARVQEAVEQVKQIADQSNLLAVNASIEAAKAGEVGRGFAVVASEVRNLATESKQAAVQIRAAIERTQAGRMAVESAHASINRLATVLDDTSEQARQISGAAAQQAAGIRQITDAMVSVEEGGQSMAGASSALEAAVVDLSDLGTELQIYVSGRAARST